MPKSKSEKRQAEVYVAFSIHGTNCFITANKNIDADQASSFPIRIDGENFTKGFSRDTPRRGAIKLMWSALEKGAGKPLNDPQEVLNAFQILKNAGWTVEDAAFIRKHGVKYAVAKRETKTDTSFIPNPDIPRPTPAKPTVADVPPKTLPSDPVPVPSEPTPADSPSATEVPEQSPEEKTEVAPEANEASKEPVTVPEQVPAPEEKKDPEPTSDAGHEVNRADSAAQLAEHYGSNPATGENDTGKETPTPEKAPEDPAPPAKEPEQK